MTQNADLKSHLNNDVIDSGDSKPLPKESSTNNLLKEVSDQLNNSADNVKAEVVKLLVAKEITKRVELLDKGLAKLKEFKKELGKIKPSDKFTVDGIKIPGDFTKEEFESLKKAKEKVSKLENALEKAFAGQEFDKLAGLV